MTSEVVTSDEELTSLEPAWTALVEASPSPNIFLSWEWITSWGFCLAHEDALRVVVARDPDTGDIVGITPFVIQRRPSAGPPIWRELVFMGCTVTGPDHLACIAGRGWERPVARSAVEWLGSASSRREWDVLRLDGVNPESDLCRTLLKTAARGPAAVWDVSCPFVSLPDRWDEFESSLKGKFRRNLRRRMRNLKSEAPDPVSLVTVAGGEDLPDALSDLFRLHQSVRSRNGSGGAFDSAAKREFYRHVAHRFSHRGWLRVHLLKVGGRSIGAALSFHFGGKVWFYQTGYDNAWSCFSPGSVVIRHAIRSAIEDGAREFDMLRGDHPYKYDWNAESRSILKVRLAASATGGVVVPLTGWLRSARQRWKTWRGAH